MKVVKVIGAAAVVLCFGTMTSVYAQREGQGDKREEKRGKPDRPQGGQEKGAPPAHAQQPHQPQRQQQERQPQQSQRKEQPRQQAQPQRAQQPEQQRQQLQQPQRGQQPAQQRQQKPKPQRAQQSAQQRQQLPLQRTQQQARTWQQQRGWQQQTGAWKAHDTWQQDRAQRWSSDHRTWEQRGGYGGYYVPQDRFNLYFGSAHFFRIGARPVMYMGYPRFRYGGFSFLLVDPWPESWSENWYASDDVYIDYDDGYYLYNRRYPYIRLAVTVEV